MVPFRVMINKETPRDGFLFGDHNGPWSTEHLTKAMTRETSKRIGFRMTTQEYRHIAIAIDRKFIRGLQAEVDDDEDDEDDLNDEMAAHSTKVAIAHYARLGGLSRNPILILPFSTPSKLQYSHKHNVLTTRLR